MSQSLYGGYGILYWKVGENKLRHPVITSKANIIFDEKSGRIKVHHQEMSSPTLEMEFLHSIKDTNIKDLNILSEEMKNKDLNPWDKKELKKLL